MTTGKFDACRLPPQRGDLYLLLAECIVEEERAATLLWPSTNGSVSNLTVAAGPPV